MAGRFRVLKTVLAFEEAIIGLCGSSDSRAVGVVSGTETCARSNC